jgi:predicted esterase
MPTKKHDSTVIFLHGLAQNGRYWADKLRQNKFAVSMPSTKFIFPTAPRLQVRSKGGEVPSWFHFELSDFAKHPDKSIDRDKLERCLQTVQSIQEIGIEYLEIFIILTSIFLFFVIFS